MLLSRFLNSFRCAILGLVRTAREERNFRVHLVAVCYVTWVGFLAKLGALNWAAVLLCFGAVLSAELLNTSLEHLCDAVCPGENLHIKAAKDAAAGAVLVLAAVSIGVAVVVFGPWVYSGNLIQALTEKRWVLPIFVISLPIALLWIRGKKN